MSKLGLIININGFDKTFFNFEKTFVCNDLEHAKLILVNYLASNLNILNIDYPLNFDELDYHWFDNNNVNAKIFSYKIFNDNVWSEPWDYDDIYSDILETMNKQEIDNAPNFSKLYSENIDKDEDDDNLEKVNNDIEKNINNQDTKTLTPEELAFETIIKDIISKS